MHLAVLTSIARTCNYCNIIHIVIFAHSSVKQYPLGFSFYQDSIHENFACTGHVAGFVTSVARNGVAAAFNVSAGAPLRPDPFHEDAAIEEHIDAGITLANAVNFLVERYELVRIDRKGFTWQEQTPFLTATDILRVRRATGIMST